MELRASEDDYTSFKIAFGYELPMEMRLIYESFNGFSGSIGDRHLSIFPLSDLKLLNDKYHEDRRSTEHVIFGSDGGGESFGFLKTPKFQIVSVPFVPLNLKFIREISNSSKEFIDAFKNLSHSEVTSSEDYEIVEITPIAFGGSPTDERNKSRIDRARHIEYVRFWNQKYQEASSE